MERLNAPTIQWGAAAAPLPGETESGDRYVVQPFALGVLVGVVDAVGHGRRAAKIAAQAIDALGQHAQDSVAALVARWHGLLRQSCGASMSVASLDWRSHQMSWLGIGNVAGVLVPHAFLVESRIKHLLVRGGVVGGDLPDLVPTMIKLAPRDTLIMATDGIRERFADALPDRLAPQPLAEHIFSRYAKSTDDALVLVVRYSVRYDERQR